MPKKQLDLGCGSLPAFLQHGLDGYEHYGVDIIEQDIPNVLKADLAINPIPFNDDVFELVTAHEVLEHIPKVLYFINFNTDPHYLIEDGGRMLNPVQAVRRNCLIELFNEIYRVLKHDGILQFDVPVAGTPAYYGDPTHVSEWTEDSVNYYSGDYFGFHDDYGHTSKFKKVKVERTEDRDWQLNVTLRAIKPAEPPYEL